MQPPPTEAAHWHCIRSPRAATRAPEPTSPGIARQRRQHRAALRRACGVRIGSDATRDLGITVGTLRRWIDASRPQPEVLLTDDERTELRRLRKENRELRMEREILKKATAFFAKHSE